MSKFCCCSPDPELPDISINVKCACCESQVEEKSAAKDSTDFSIAMEEKEKETEQKTEEEENSTCCCCFRRKRHANKKRKHNRESHHE